MHFSIEELTMNAWPSIQTMFFDGWILRMANGYTKRANSIKPMYSFDKNADEKIKHCEEIYGKNNLPTIFKIIECKEHEKLDKILENSCYEKVDLTSVQISNDIKQKTSQNNGIITDIGFSDDWKKCFYECNGINDKDLKTTIEAMLNNIKVDKITVYKRENGIFLGCGYGVIENGFVGLFDIIVKTENRGKGYGEEIVKTILKEANEKGIEKAYLAVVDNNTIAKKLYEKLGFKEVYKYWYRKK
jgi:GNAT superfamily N-acetyltransferase